MSAAFARLAGLLVATLVLDLVLIQPNHPAAMTWDALRLFPLELPVVLLGLIALPKRGAATAIVRTVLVLALVVVAVLKVADYALFTAFGRTFNPLVDIHLIEAGLRLAAGTFGQLPTIFGAVAAALAPFALAALLWWATGRWAAVSPPAGLRLASAGLAVAAAMVVVADIGDVRGAWDLPVDPPGTAFTARVAIERANAYSRLVADMQAFREAADNDRYADAGPLFDRLEGRDVVVVFIESYGRTSFDNPLYAPTHTATLEAAEPALEAAGLGVRSGWLTSPIAGGQSWLAHGTFASGLRTGNQARYSAMLASTHRTLYHLASASGYHTAAIMPAITLPWPESRMLGFETAYPAAELGYRGEPFNWVTMPDQYTLSAFDRLLGDHETPLFAEIALVSSHAPWTPVPELIDWSEVGDGSVFTPQARAGDPPSVVWADRDRVRDQYRLSIDYSLRTIMDYAVRRADEDRLTIILGDHPPASFVSQIDSGDVPIHFIGPPNLLEEIDAWDWHEGLIPDASTPVWPMEAFRDRFIAAFTSEPVPEPQT